MNEKETMQDKPLSEFFKGLNITILMAPIVGLMVGSYLGVNAMGIKYTYNCESLGEVLKILVTESPQDILAISSLLAVIGFFIYGYNKHVFPEISRRCNEHH